MGVFIIWEGGRPFFPFLEPQTKNYKKKEEEENAEKGEKGGSPGVPRGILSAARECRPPQPPG